MLNPLTKQSSSNSVSYMSIGMQNLIEHHTPQYKVLLYDNISKDKQVLEI